MTQPPPSSRCPPARVSSGTYPVGRPRLPEAGVDYPRNDGEHELLFGEESSCLRAVERLRWPRGFRCPACGQAAEPERAGRLLRCRACGRVVLLTNGTTFRNSLTPLRLWMALFWRATERETGTDPHLVQRVFGLSDERSAWDYLERLRQTVVAATQEPLRGDVELVRCHVDVANTTRRGGGPAIVALLVERKPAQLERARARCLNAADPAAVLALVRASVAPGSRIFTGRWVGYERLANNGYEHRVSVAAGRDGAPRVLLPHAQRVAELLRIWLWTTPGAHRARLDHYLDEFCFRFERRLCSHGLRFFQLLRAAVPIDDPTAATASEPATLRPGAARAGGRS